MTKYWQIIGMIFVNFMFQVPLGLCWREDFDNRFSSWVFAAFIHFGYNLYSLDAYSETIGGIISCSCLLRLFNEAAGGSLILEALRLSRASSTQLPLNIGV